MVCAIVFAEEQLCIKRFWGVQNLVSMFNLGMVTILGSMPPIVAPFVMKITCKLNSISSRAGDTPSGAGCSHLVFSSAFVVFSFALPISFALFCIEKKKKEKKKKKKRKRKKKKKKKKEKITALQPPIPP